MSYYKTVNLLKRTVPYMGEDLYEHDYLAFGQFDVLDILKEKHSLKGLWESYKDKEIKIRSKTDTKTKYFSSQPLFLARNEHWSLEDDFPIDEANNYYEKYPFIFIVLLHARKDIPQNNKPRNNKDIIKGLISGNFDYSSKEERSWQSWMGTVCKKIKHVQKTQNDFEFECYYPLNFSQGAVCIYAKSYGQITKLLANLVRENQKEISYAYTISGLKNTWIKDQKELEQDEKVDVSFDIVINHIDEFNKLRDKLDDNLQSKSKEEREIVGNADVHLTYKNVSINSLISVYKDIISPKENYYKYGVSTLISTWLCKADLDSFKEGIKKNPPLLKHQYSMDTESLFEKPEYSQSNKKALFSLLEVAEMLSKSEYIRYIDTAIGATIQILLDNICSYEGYIKKGKKTQKEKTQYIEDVNAFLHHSQDLLSSTLRADRQFFEVPGFNMILDEIPIKLVIAYNFCLYELSLALRHDDQDYKVRKYAFLGYPKMTDTMTVLRLFLDHKNYSRLYCMSLPWDGIFNIRRMLPQLTHEIGHCISNRARNRKYRYDHLIKLISMLLVYHIYEFDNENETDCTSTFVDNYTECIKKYDDSLVVKKKKDKFYGKERYYNHWLRHSLPQAVEWVLLDEDFNYKMWIEYAENKHLNFDKRFLTNEEWKKLEAYERLSRNNRVYMLSDRCTFNFRTIVDFTLELGSECFADLFMIMVLCMDYNSYLLSFLDAGYVNLLEDVYQYARIKAVYKALVSTDIWNEQGCFINTDNRPSQPLSKNEDDYLTEIKKGLDKVDNVLIEMINDTIGIYLIKCISKLKSYNFKDMDLLTKKLYHDSCGSKDDNGAINYIQELLWKVGGEI